MRTYLSSLSAIAILLIGSWSNGAWALNMDEILTQEKKRFSLSEEHDYQKCKQRYEKVAIAKYPGDQTASLSPRCRYLIQLSGYFSGRSRFRFLAELELNFRTRNPKSNHRRFVRELMNYHSSPESYVKRYPLLASYFQSLFERDSQDSALSISMNHLPVPLDDQHVLFGVELMVVSPGEALLSRLGHIMFNRVQCDKNRSNTLDECRKKRRSHEVVSVLQQEQSSGMLIDGFTGRSQLITRIDDFQVDFYGYTVAEERQIHAILLPLNRRELQFFLNLTEAMSRQAYTSWNHLTRNCTTTAIQILKATAEDDRFYDLIEFTPSKFFTEIQSRLPDQRAKQVTELDPVYEDQ